MMSVVVYIRIMCLFVIIVYKRFLVIIIIIYFFIIITFDFLFYFRTSLRTFRNSDQETAGVLS